MKGNIFNIQKFSIHDGPGVRTTVFLKGCPLRCKWCANPESQAIETQITYDRKKCIHCLTCVNVCPSHCIAHENDGEDGYITINHDNCVGCLTCVHSCPGRALSSEGEMMELDEVVRKCLQDIDFYEESRGGVTLSGGECMCQPEFTEALIGKLKKHNIHMAAETTGYIEPSVFRHLAPLFDLLLFDVKHYDANAHLAGTGVANDLIIENLTWAHEHGLTILPRIPVIPGFNAATEDADGIADLLLNIGLTEVQLLPFHQFGERKYELLGKNYSLKAVKALYPEDLKDYQAVFAARGIRAFF
jgi:pyruvate formate lyase activating enzyme